MLVKKNHYIEKEINHANSLLFKTTKWLLWSQEMDLGCLLWSSIYKQHILLFNVIINLNIALYNVKLS